MLILSNIDANVVHVDIHFQKSYDTYFKLLEANCMEGRKKSESEIGPTINRIFYFSKKSDEENRNHKV